MLEEFVGCHSLNLIHFRYNCHIQKLLGVRQGGSVNITLQAILLSNNWKLNSDEESSTFIAINNLN